MKLSFYKEYKTQGIVIAPSENVCQMVSGAENVPISVITTLSDLFSALVVVVVDQQVQYTKLEVIGSL